MTTFQANKKIDKAKHRAALRNIKRLATLLFVGMAILFIISFRLGKTYPILSVVRAFSEAAMVGALADWFAVVALFRHPLNRPIPHTAIIQQHKVRFGENLAVFIKNNFLACETLEEKLRDDRYAGLAWRSIHKPAESAKNYGEILGTPAASRQTVR